MNPNEFSGACQQLREKLEDEMEEYERHDINYISLHSDLRGLERTEELHKKYFGDMYLDNNNVQEERIVRPEE
jgi:hypothetical protein